MQEFEDSRTEMEAFLRSEVLGYLSMNGPDGPYVVPLNYAYDDGRILVHCSHSGKKLDMLRADPRVCFAVARQEGPVEQHAKKASCHVPSDSVVCYGRARILDDLDERAAALTAFLRHYKPEAKPMPREDVEACACVEIALTPLTGRRARPARTVPCWRWSFA